MAVMNEKEKKVLERFHLQEARYSWNKEELGTHSEAMKKLIALGPVEGYVEFASDFVVFSGEPVREVSGAGELQHALLCSGDRTIEVIRNFNSWLVLEINKGEGEEMMYCEMKQIGNRHAGGKRLAFEHIIGSKDDSLGVLSIRFAGFREE